MRKEPFLVDILEDQDFFSKKLDDVVRISCDKEVETLDQILHRIYHSEGTETISYEKFIGFFCKRGMLREGEEVVF